MMKWLQQILAAAGIEIPADKKAAVDAILKQAEDENQPPQPGKGGEMDPAKLLARLEASERSNESLRQDIKTLTEALGKESQTREASAKVLLEKEQAEKKARVDKAIEDAVKAGKIPSQNEVQKTNWATMLTNDFDAASKALDAIPGTNPGADQGKPGGSGQGQPGAKAPEALPGEALMKASAEAFQAKTN